MILDVLNQMFEMFRSQIINVPTDNNLSVVYVVLNLVASILLLLIG